MESKVPKEILEGSTEQKLAFFDDQYIPHHHLEVALEDLVQKIINAGPETIIYVIGPGGLGKSALKREIIRELYARFKNELEIDRGRILLVDYEIELAADTIAWPEFLRGLLYACGEPLVERKLAATRIPGAELVRASQLSADRYLRSYKNYRKQRRPLVVIFDDAHNLAKTRSKHLQWVLDPLIGMCRPTPHVLIGAPLLMELRNLSFQLGHRSVEVFLHSYNCSDPEDQAHFATALLRMEPLIPTEKPPDLVGNVEYLMTGALGLVGFTRRWLRSALELALRRGSETIELEDLQRTFPEEGKRREAAKEIYQLENQLLTGKKEAFNLAMKNFHEVEEKLAAKAKANAAKGKRGRAPKVQSRRKSTPVGKRNPCRDSTEMPEEFQTAG